MSPDVIDLSGAAPRLPADVMTRFHDHLAKAASEPRLWSEPAKFGDPLLREQLAARHGRRPDEVCVTAGVRSAALIYGRTAHHVHLERPTFEGLVPALTVAGAALSRWTWDEPPAVDRTRDAGGTVLVWATSPCRNPDGRTLTREQYRTLARLGSRPDTTVVVNRTYAIGPPDDLPDGLDLVGGLHKTWGIGARIGFAIGNGFATRAVTDLAAWAPSAIWQRAWGGFLADPHYDEAAARIRGDALRAVRAFADEAGPADAEASGSPHLLLDRPPGWTGAAFARALAAVGVKVSPGTAFGASAHQVRLSFTGVTERQARAAGGRLAELGILERRPPEHAS
ncbi:pyridoxal phosphate-dependent aminotransferase [Streptomyces sp. SP18CS02]|uniref:pyridoxal phosphate-dependent aminotransferase n=1 Tax=Streptomyces sp. SP18CS02 TaxID=3002531 RepID=UPI002E78F72C|nr:pyridoxal phosphate-dependent aminotransferase [Streptomyces sp. SP18CS02]MEE1752754.1 pyridoxal phosphate-dependent aminotransferase [Streptomyces sp. SP18CS02]